MPMPGVEAVHGDITTLEVDAIVNAANNSLSGGWGVDGAIHEAAGAAQLQAACAELGAASPETPRRLPGFMLPARFIIHTVGPVWRGGFRGEAEVLASCYRRSLEVADEIGAKSVAFPAISTGIYEYPPDAAARIAVDSVRFAVHGRGEGAARRARHRHLRALPEAADDQALDYDARERADCDVQAEVASIRQKL